MLLLNIDYIPDQEIEVLGLVQGSIVQATDAIMEFAAGIRAIGGGDVTEYSEMLAKARQSAVERMMGQAETLCADAVINIRFATSGVMQGAAEIIAYGTAVKFK